LSHKVTPEDSFHRVCIIYTGLTMLYFRKRTLAFRFVMGTLKLSTYN